jgi:predicted ATPase
VLGDDLRSAATICRRLDGIPLAIEFAAARAATLGCGQVASHLDDRFGLLTGGRRTALPRHQTLQATLDWSYDLLPEYERRLLSHLAIFPGAFSLDAATAVMGAGTTPLAVLEGIANLVAKSLVIIEGPEATARWRLLETIRAYGLKKLAGVGATAEAARRHAEFFQRAFPATDSGLSLKISTADMARYVLEIDNVRAALDWSYSPAGDPTIGISLTAAFGPTWLHLNLMSECRERSEKALNQLAPDSNLDAPLRMRLYLALGRTFTWTMGSTQKSKEAYSKALELADGLDDVDEQLHSLWLLWGVQYSSEDWPKAKQTVARFSQVTSRSDSPVWDFVGRRMASYMLHYDGRLSDARSEIEHLLDRFSALTEQRYSSWSLHDQYTVTKALLARTLWLQGFVDQAVDHVGTILEEAETSGYSIWLCDALRVAVCPVSIMTGDTVLAERILKLLYERAAQFQAPYFVACAQGYEGILLIRRGDIEPGLKLLRVSLERYERAGWTIQHSEMIGSLAEGLSALGNQSEALSVADGGVTRLADGVGRWHLAELLRIKAEAQIKIGTRQSVVAAENGLLNALAVAREQGALFWELRISSSLAHLRMSQGRQGEAHDALASVYGRFTEGFETADLISAKALLDALPASRT